MVELPETVANPLLRVLLLVPRDQDSGTRGSFGRWSQTTRVGAEVGARTRGGQAACSHASASRLSLWAPGAWSPWGTLGVRDHGPLPGHSFRRPRELGRRSSTSCRSWDAGCLRLRRLRWDVKKGAGTQAKSAGLKAPKLRASQEHGPRLPRSLHCGHFLAWRRAHAGPSAARDGIHQRTQTRHAFRCALSLSPAVSERAFGTCLQVFYLRILSVSYLSPQVRSLGGRGSLLSHHISGREGYRARSSSWSYFERHVT